jgi:hypothetical protein
MRKASKKDHGFVLPFKCTSCQHRGQKLIEIKTTFFIKDIAALVVSILLNEVRPSWLFQCPKCELETGIPKEETNAVIALLEEATLFHQGKMTQDEYLTIVMATESQTIKDMYGRNKSWECPSCQTDIPATFATCWNCETECPNPEELILFEGEELQFNTNVLWGDTYSVKRD